IWRLGISAGIATTAHDRRNLDAKPSSDFLERYFIGMIFHDIVKQSSDSLILSSPALQDDAGNCERVRDVWDVRALTYVFAVDLSRPPNRLIEPCRKHHGVRLRPGA